MQIRNLISLILLYTITSQLYAQESRYINNQDSHQYDIEKIEKPIKIDGVLDEATWQNENYTTGFWFTFPIDGQQVKEESQTKIWIRYDDDFIYVAAVCKGNGGTVVQTLKRDSREYWSGDNINVVIDPNNQKTNGFLFGVNPSNVQYDALVTGNTGRRGDNSSGFSSAWDNKWYSATKEYGDHWTAEFAIPLKTLRFGDSKEWGFNFVRTNSEDNSFQAWAPVPVMFRSLDLGYTGVVRFEEPPKKIKSNIAIIPYMLTSTYKDHEAGTPSVHNFEIGGDAKIAVTPSLNLDLTYNPDFSQVEVDQQVTNLTTVNIRFPERRLFFLENADIFSDFGIPPMRPFFSRRIGLDESGNAIPILYGARLSGNLNDDLRLGVMNLQTRSTDDAIGQNYTSIALHQRVLKRSIIKGYIHNRQGYDGEFLKDNYNRTAGLEFNYRSEDGKFETFAGIGKSFSNGDTDKNTFGHWAIGYDSRSWTMYFNYATVGADYNTDIGWMPRINHYDAEADVTYQLGFHHDYTNLGYSIYAAEQSAINSHQFSISHIGDVTRDGFDLIQSVILLDYDLSWKNSSRFSIGYRHDDQSLLYPFKFTDGDALPVDTYSFNSLGVSYSSDRRKALSYMASVELGGFYGGERKEYSLSVNYRRRPWGIFGVNFVQNILNFSEPYGNEKLFLVGPRIEFNFSNNLFWTTFLQYNTQRDNFNVNSRFQWRFKPLSDIFLVYTDNYAIDLWGPKNRALVLKMNYWLNL